MLPAIRCGCRLDSGDAAPSPKGREPAAPRGRVRMAVWAFEHDDGAADRIRGVASGDFREVGTLRTPSGVRRATWNADVPVRPARMTANREDFHSGGGMPSSAAWYGGASGAGSQGHWPSRPGVSRDVITIGAPVSQTRSCQGCSAVRASGWWQWISDPRPQTPLFMYKGIG
jgi:hypothetical protein